MRALYNALYLVWVTLILPQVFFEYFFRKKYRGNLLSRLGLKRTRFPEKKKKRIWIHAVSLGETKAAGPLLSLIKEKRPEVEIIFSTTTETGQKEALANRAIDFCFFLPLDLPFFMRRTARALAPDLFILVETDFWLNLLTALKDQGTQVVLVNGKISEGSLRKFLAIPSLARELFESVDLFALQSDEYHDRFSALGVPKEKIVITGNLKFDISPQAPPLDGLYFPVGKRCITVASTHEGEEVAILDALKDFTGTIFLAPRHPERFPKVAKLLESRRIPFRRVGERGSGDERVILVDRIGVLDPCYQSSFVAVLGGSFFKGPGGHNIYEPVRLGVPVIYGPHMQKQRALVESLQKHNIGKQVEVGSLAEAVANYNKNREDIASYTRLKAEMEGATLRTFNLIEGVYEFS